MEIAEMHDDAAHMDGLGARVMDRLHQMVCGLHGHDTMLQFEQDRMFLRCQSCGHETPGWDLRPAEEALPQTAESASARAVRVPFVDQRRVA